MAQAKQSAENVIPLTPRVFQILLALVDGEQHGYRILKDVEERSAGKVLIGPGTLYEAIHRLVESEWIVESKVRSDALHHDRRRRYYRLTGFGRAVLKAEAERLSDVVSFAESKKLIRKRRPA